MTNLSAWKMAGAVLMVCGATAIVASAQTFSTLLDFNGSNGSLPTFSSLVQGVDGTFYGTTAVGAFGLCGETGTGFKVTSRGTLKSAAYFPESYSGVILASDQNFYGTSYCGGTYGHGTVFRTTPAGVLTVLHSFCAQGLPCADGRDLLSGLVEGVDGNFYGTTYVGGIENEACRYGCGTIFRITPAGSLVTIHSFCAQGDCPDGSLPIGPLVQGRDGSFYGTTVAGGDLIGCNQGGCGTVFKITPTGTLTTLYIFGDDGVTPMAGLIEASDGNFYGTTYGGFGNSTVFRITSNGELTTLYTFNDNDGRLPYATLLQATDGNLYGSTSEGGTNEQGTIFKITTDGVLTTLHRFDDTDGANPESALMQATTGLLYGMTDEGGDLSCNPPKGCGTIFSLDMDLGPFVTFVRGSGKVGQTGDILGQEFTGTTSIALNGTAANFIVVSDTLIRATVPTGATTGYVTVTTPSGTLTSNVPFRVLK